MYGAPQKGAEVRLLQVVSSGTWLKHAGGQQATSMLGANTPHEVACWLIGEWTPTCMNGEYIFDR